MKRKLVVLLVVLMMAAVAVFPASAGGRGDGPVIYVTSQGLYYDSIVLTDLPAKGRFQKLEVGVGPTGLQTEFGPGDQGYVGGRWWIDNNGNNEMDSEDTFLLCPLLGPGRETP